MAEPWAALRPGPDFLDILDQRVLPLTQRYLHCQSGDDVVEGWSEEPQQWESRTGREALSEIHPPEI